MTLSQCKLKLVNQTHALFRNACVSSKSVMLLKWIDKVNHRTISSKCDTSNTTSNKLYDVPMIADAASSSHMKTYTVFSQGNFSAFKNTRTKLLISTLCLGNQRFPTTCQSKNKCVPKSVPVNETQVTFISRSFCSSSTSDASGDTNESWEALVDYEQLSQQDIKIHERHRDAVKNGLQMYVDPQTGYHVMTRVAHLERGSCCGNACRHCPFGQVKVADEKKKKKFNSAFYF